MEYDCNHQKDRLYENLLARYILGFAIVAVTIAYLAIKLLVDI